MPALALDDDAALAQPLRYVYGLTVVAQRVRLRLLTATGEWLTDVSVGLPYDDWTGAGAKDAPTPEELGALVRAQLEDTPGIVRVVSLTATSADNGRHLSVVARCEAREDGEDGLIEARTVPNPLATFGPPAWYVYAVSG